MKKQRHGRNKSKRLAKIRKADMAEVDRARQWFKNRPDEVIVHQP